jgi:outer membrane protein TolC
VVGPRGTDFSLISPKTIDVAVFNQNFYISTIMAVQPITALLKVKQGVKIAEADQHIAQAQLDAGARALASGAEQLYWGLLAAQRIRAGALEAVSGAEEVAKLGTVEARLALQEARQGLNAVENQVADLEAQLNALLDQPACTHLELVEPPFPLPPVTCGDEAADLAVSVSPEVHEAEQNVVKAHAAVCAAKVDYLPNVAVMGGYANQTLMDSIQPNFSYLGVTATWTLWAWGKRKHTVNERDTLVSMASLKVQQTQDEVRQKALKAFREFHETHKTLALAADMARLRKEAEKAAQEPADKFAAAKASMEAQVDLVKADLAYRVAYVKLMALISKP